jgi:hypothetical protein
MSRKKITATQMEAIKSEYYSQMNILNGNDDLGEAVSKYVALLEDIVISQGRKLAANGTL